MKRLTELILAHAEQLPEGTPLTAKGLLRFGTRAGVDQALSRMAKREELIRAGRGIYFLPVKSRFGTHCTRPPWEWQSRRWQINEEKPSFRTAGRRQIG